MAKFLYRMQNVLDVKLKMEDQARSAFADAMANFNLEEEKMAAIVARREYYEAEGRKLREDILDPFKMRDNGYAIDNLKEQEAAQQLRVDEAAKDLERARNKLQIAMQERKTQEKLKENAFEDFKRELNAAESKEVDELVSYRFGNSN